MTLVDTIRSEISRALSRVRPAIRGVLSASPRRRTDAPSLTDVRGLGDQVVPNVELLQHAGLVAGLPSGTPVIVLPVGGSATHSVVIASDWGAYRVDVGVGEVALHHLTEPNCYVWLKAGRVVGIRGAKIVLQADEEISLDAPVTKMTGAAQVAKTLDAAEGVVSSGIEFDAHRHRVESVISDTPI